MGSGANTVFGYLLHSAWKVIQNPAMNREGSTLLMAAIAVAALSVVLLLSLVLMPSRRVVRKRVRYWVPEGQEPPEAYVVKAPEQAQRPPKARSKTQRRLDALVAGRLTVPILVAAAIASGYVASSQDHVCSLSCHSGGPVIAAVRLDHAHCVECHDSAGLTGVPSNVSDRLRMTVGQISRVETRTGAVVDSRSCLRCHRSILEDTVFSERTGVRMRHAEPLEAGMRCVQCHPGTGHRRKAEVVHMSRCIGCHDGESADSGCNTCHVENAIATTTNVSHAKSSYPKVAIGDADCGGCHNVEKQCDPCHQIRMPHSAKFLDGYHAREAAWAKKQLCWRCHQENDCSRCHLVPFDTSHSPGWRSEHVRSPRDSGCVCHSRSKDRALRPGELCTYCHER